MIHCIMSITSIMIVIIDIIINKRAGQEQRPAPVRLAVRLGCGA